jgi:aspartate/glutamate racemase
MICILKAMTYKILWGGLAVREGNTSVLEWSFHGESQSFQELSFVHKWEIFSGWSILASEVKFIGYIRSLLAMKMSFHTLNCTTVILGSVKKNKTQFRNPSVAAQISSVPPINFDESGNLLESKRNLSSGMTLKRCQAPNSLLSQRNTVGIIGGVSVFSTLIFLEKLVLWSSKDGQECVPFVVCSDPAISEELPVGSFHSFNSTNAKIQFNHAPIVGNLQRKRVFLEQSGARCIVMPCHLSHAWHSEISEGCSLPFLHVGDCVTTELSEAKFRPLEAGSDVRIGVLATPAAPIAGFYQEKLRSQVSQFFLFSNNWVIRDFTPTRSPGYRAKCPLHTSRVKLEL